MEDMEKKLEQVLSTIKLLCLTLKKILHKLLPNKKKSCKYPKGEKKKPNALETS